jgi:curved DNA-binding protein CbpA
MALPDYYAVLEVASTATSDEIKQAYRRLARLYHPDLNKQTEDTRIKRLNEAYAVLSDPLHRTTYDIQRLEKMKRDVIVNFIVQQREQARREKRLTWAQGAAGFVKELKKGMQE